VDEDYIDNVDYNPSGYDLYFPYDYLENLGEYKKSPLYNGYYYAHGYYWFSHYEPAKSISKPWLCFIGTFGGQYWYEQCEELQVIPHQIIGATTLMTLSPLSPIFEANAEQPSHEWTNFTEVYSPIGFGNLIEHPLFTTMTKFYTSDPPDGD
jgi:hypothetical protein